MVKLHGTHGSNKEEGRDNVELMRMRHEGEVDKVHYTGNILAHKRVQVPLPDLPQTDIVDVIDIHDKVQEYFHKQAWDREYICDM